MSHHSGETLPSALAAPSASTIDSVNGQVAADVWMESLQGELVGNGLSIGFDNQPKSPDKPSGDSEYAYIDDNGNAFIAVFDGMGGYGSDDIMSKTARSVMHGYATRNLRLTNPDAQAEDIYPDIVDAIERKKELDPTVNEDAGTTGLYGIVTTINGEQRFVGAAVGDSLGYIVRANGEVVQLNKEETVRQELLNGGSSTEEAEKGNAGTTVTNALFHGFEGVEQKFNVHVFDGDVIVLTSDGITGDKSTQRLSGGESNEAVIREIVLNKSMTPKQKAQALIERSTKPDDRTAIVVEIGDSWIHKVSNQELSNDMVELHSEIEARRVGGLAVGHSVVIPQEREEVPDRNDVVFAAYNPELGMKPIGESDYDSLFSKDDIAYPDYTILTPEQRLADNLQKRFSVTAESINYSRAGLYAVQQFDETIKDAIAAFKTSNPSEVTDQAIMKALRENGELRKSVGVRLLELVQNSSYGTGIYEDKKTPSHPGYEAIPNLKPEEYVALLMLSMIDGTYKPKTGSSNIDRNRHGDIENGRSTYAALGVFNDLKRTFRA